MPFLTDLDSRAAIKGSRYPLGVQAVWTRLGRGVIGNLTTVSTSVRDFTVTMLGYYFAGIVAEETGAGEDSNVFLRWEQLAAYARGGGNGDWKFRGTERAKKNWNESDRIRLAADPEAMILSDQKTYGLWGLYSVPSRSSGLLEGNPARLTGEARSFVEKNYAPVIEDKLTTRGKGLGILLGDRSVVIRPKDKDRAMFDVVAKLLRNKFGAAERSFYVRHLIERDQPSATEGGQRVLANAMKTTLGFREWKLTPEGLKHLAKECRASAGETGDLVGGYLDRIRIAEQLFAPCVRLFAFLLTRDKQSLEEVAQSIRKQWRPRLTWVNPACIREFGSELADDAGDRSPALRWLEAANALAAGDYAGLIRNLLERNREVMLIRGGAGPWAEIRDQKLHVRFVAEETAALPTTAELPHYLSSKERLCPRAKEGSQRGRSS
jgi:hypothetical protein